MPAAPRAQQEHRQFFFKSILQETGKFFLGSIAAGLLAPGAKSSRCSRVKPSDTFGCYSLC